jgi:hypothetical protein
VGPAPNVDPTQSGTESLRSLRSRITEKRKACSNRRLTTFDVQATNRVVDSLTASGAEAAVAATVLYAEDFTGRLVSITGGDHDQGHARRRGPRESALWGIGCPGAKQPFDSRRRDWSGKRAMRSAACRIRGGMRRAGVEERGRMLREW